MSWALFAMVLFGFGEVIGGFVHGLVIDKLGSKRTVFVNATVMMIMTGTALASIMSKEFNALSFVMCFCWGWNDGVTNTWMY